MKKSRYLSKAINSLLILMIVTSTLLIVDVQISYAWTAPTMDGKLDDVYREYGSITRYGDTSTHAATGLDNYAAAYLYVLEDENYVYVFYHQDVFYANDNSYGENSLHWESRKNGIRNFADIWESDMGEFTFKDAVGNVVTHFYVDQLAEDATKGSGYACGGFGPNTPDNSPWNDGLWIEGDIADQAHFEIRSVMGYNLNETGYCSGGSCTCGTSGIDLLADSPEADGTYQVTDSGCSDWQWYNGWEMRVDKSAFGALGFGVVIGNHHNSPTKTCEKKNDCPTDLFLPWSTIGDRVWHDLDRDGVQDSGEPGLQGITINLIDPRDGSLLERQFTDSNGEYIFEMLSHMYYIVEVDETSLPAGFSSTTSVASPTDYHGSYVNNVCGADCIQRDGATYTRVYYIPLDHPQDYRTADFGYGTDGAVIGDYVWSDADNDGVQDLGEPGIGGVEVELLAGDGNPFDPVITTTTNDAGWYMFYDLLAGEYKVRVTSSNFDPGGPLVDYVLSAGPESNPTPTDTITLATDEAYMNADFGYYNDSLGSIGDYIWYDYDNDGTQDAGEDPAEGVTLALYIDSNANTDLDPGEPAIADTITDANGAYTFTGLELNEYYLVKVTDSDGVLDGFTITTYWGDDPVPSVDPVDIDRYNNPAPVNLTDTTTDVAWADFGFNRPGSVGDTVWFDWDQDGVQDPGEIGVDNVSVTLGGDDTDFTTTDPEGKYLFAELGSGSYTVTVSIPVGYSLSTGTPNNPHNLSITGNESYLNADFGLWRSDAYTLGDLVWDDLDGDGYKDASENGIADVTIDLYADTDGDGVQDPTEPLLETVTTDINGLYAFYGLVDGDYLVIVSDNNSILDGYTWTDGIDDTNDNSQVTPYAVSVSGANINHADFGYDLNPTWVSVSSFDVYENNGQVVVEWQTAAESGTVGFKLYRQGPDGKFLPVHDGLLPGLLHSPQGGTYRYLDSEAEPGETYSYTLQEVEYNGAEQQYGPYSVEVDQKRSGSLSLSSAVPYSKMAHPVQTLPTQEDEILGGGAENVAPPSTVGGFQVFIPLVFNNYNPGETPVGKPAKVSVSESGLYTLPAGDIANAMDLSTSYVENLINDQKLQVVHKGQQISYLLVGENDGIYFYGEAIESIYTNTNVYWLIQGDGEIVESASGVGPEPLVDEQSFTQVLHFEEDNHALTALFDDPQSDYWLWDMFTAGDPAKSYTFRTNGATESGSVTLDVYLQGATDTEADPDHHVIINLVVGEATHQIGESWWNGTDSHHFQLSFDPDLLSDGDNELEVVAVLDDGVPYSIFYLDSFGVTYERYYRAVDDALTFPGQDLAVITIRDFTNSEIFIFDITNAQEPVLLTATTVSPQGENFSVSFTPDPGDKQYLAVSNNGLSNPDSLVEDVASDLKSGSNGAEYLIITVDDLMASTQPLLTYRQGQGLLTMAVDIEDIYDEFNYGIANPEAIKDFLDYATNNWTTAPTNVVLFGTGTYDYKDNQGYGDNLVPTVLVSAFGGLFASDTYFADVLQDDGVPDFAIGRLPVATSVEASNVIAKITSYESVNTNLWTQNVIILADNPDQGGDFPMDSDDLATTIPLGYNIDKIYLSDTPLNDARQQLIDGINTGAGFMNYIGHAGLDRMAFEGLLLSTDVATLSNAPMLPIMTAMTCVAGRFEIPGHIVLGEAMFLDSDGGAIGVWAPSGLSINDEAKALDSFFIQAIFVDGATTIGEAILSAFNDYSEGDHLRYMMEVYNLMGDPALIIGWNQ